MQTITDLKRYESGVDYKEDAERLKKFLLFYGDNGEYKYMDRLSALIDEYVVELDDIAIFDESGLATRMTANAWSYCRLLTKVIDEILANEMSTNEERVNNENITNTNNTNNANNTNTFYKMRMSLFKSKYPERDATKTFPSFLLRSYSVRLIPLSNSTPLAIRDATATNLGSLITVRGIVTKTSMVKPSIRVATYICESCSAETYQQIHTDAFDMLEECGSVKCRSMNVKGTLTLLSRGSSFQKKQSVIFQELTGDVPRGSIPRMMKLELSGTLAGKLSPGESINVSGIFLPKPYYGVRKMKAGLLNDVYLECSDVCDGGCDSSSNVVSMDNTGNVVSMDNNSNTVYHNDVTYIVNGNNNIINLLVQSFAPEIFGMTSVKKILLLMLVGAPTLNKEDGLRIRGDINVLLLGDPGIAKSQLLKTVTKLSRRGVYTTGRGSSGVGLTAAVSRDVTTGELVLEGGALVLADHGVCCIDELDKMSDVDRVAIHEVMEQQRVSISKAGINTTLNARCAILAAANPVSGRYNMKKSIEHNVGLPCSLISRFDVLCVLKDDASIETDRDMAMHVTNMHISNDDNNDSNMHIANDGSNMHNSTTHNTNTTTTTHDNTPLSYNNLRNYIDYVKTINPILPNDKTDMFIKSYLKTRRENINATPRALLALIRLSLAHARLCCHTVVTEEDVEAARELLDTMAIPVTKPTAKVIPKQEIYSTVLRLATNKVTKLEDVFSSCSQFSREYIEQVITDFESSGIWMRNNDEIIIFN